MGTSDSAGSAAVAFFPFLAWETTSGAGSLDCKDFFLLLLPVSSGTTAAGIFFSVSAEAAAETA